MRKLFIVLFILIPAATTFAQFTEVPVSDLSMYIDSQVRITTSDKSTFQGVLYEVDDNFVTLIAYSGEAVKVYRKSIVSALKLDPNIDKKSLYKDSASNRMIVMPTGFAMEPGEFHVSDQEIAAVTMSYGLNSNFSFWGGISIPGAIVSARYIHDLGEKDALSIGSFAGLSWIEFTGILLPYFIYSHGSPDHNFTLGGGTVFTFDNSEFKLWAAVLAIGGKWILSENTAIVTENWIIWGEMNDTPLDYATDPTSAWDPMPIAIGPAIAFRIAGEKFSWDIGAVVPAMVQKYSGRYSISGLTGDEWTFIPIPIISLTYRID